MRVILLILSYDGTNFNGWQRQKTNFSQRKEPLRTVQAELEDVLALIHKQPTVVFGSGRTDTGVHAFAQAAHFFSPILSIPVENYVLALNSRLPHDIRIHHAIEKPQDFHARFSAKSRVYHYHFHCGASPFASQMPYVWALYRSPNIALLNDMAAYLKGELDCTSFAAVQDKSTSKYRYIHHAYFFQNDDDMLVFEIEANAFLWKMVRSIVGTLIQLEKKESSPLEFKKILEARNHGLAGTTAPPQGLFLKRVNFN